MNNPKLTVNPHASFSISPRSLGESLWRNRQLVVQMAKRDITGRYKGSILGLTWSFFNPILMLTVYTFVFSEIFRSRWAEGQTDNKTQFAIILFVGIIVLNLFGEVMNRSPGTILENVNYVKKVIFPLEIISVVTVCTALFHAAISMIVLIVACLIFNGHINWTVIFVPFVFLPLVILNLGMSWILASLGVYLRDVNQTVAIITTILMFLSPVFYPVSAVPKVFQKFIMANPLTFIIEQAREVIVWGRTPNWHGLFFYTFVAILIALGGYVWFQKTRKGFADVL
jgi:lipopolysaccharide transport system permease protein